MFSFVLTLKTCPRHEGLKAQEVDGVDRVVSGFTCLQKTLCILLIIAPKFAIAAALYWVGSAYVLTSETNEDVIMNSVAAVLVIEVDDMIYQAMAQKRTKQVIESCPPAVTKSSSHTACMDAAVGNWLNVTLLCALVIFVNRATCL